MTSLVPAPPLKFNAIASGRTFNLRDYIGRPVILLFADYNTGRATRDVVIGIRRHYPDFTRLPIAIIVDLHVVPKIFRGTAERVMENAYRDAATEVPDNFDAADHLILLPDWTGEIVRAYNIGDVSKLIHLVAVSPESTIHASYQGPNLLPVALKFIDELLPAV